MVSIIIPTYNEEKYLPKILECLRKQSFQDFEVIVSDASSTDRTREIATSFGAKVVEGGSPAVGRNNGAAIAQSDILIFLDADNEFEENFLNNIISEFQSKNLDLSCCYYNTNRINNLKYKIALKLFNFGMSIFQYTPTPQGTSQVMIFKKEIFNKIAGFDNSLRLIEDIDIIKKVKRSNHSFKLLNTAKYFPSTRRFVKYGVVRPAIAGMIGALLVYLDRFTDQPQITVQKIYGSWGYSEIKSFPQTLND